MRAIWLRVMKGATHFYYVPAPGLRSAVYRDWIVMLLCRLFYKKTIYHYQAAGVGVWLETKAYPWERWISQFLLGRADLSMVLGDYYHEDAGKLSPKKLLLFPTAVQILVLNMMSESNQNSRHVLMRLETKEHFVFFISVCVIEKRAYLI